MFESFCIAEARFVLPSGGVYHVQDGRIVYTDRMRMILSGFVTLSTVLIGLTACIYGQCLLGRLTIGPVRFICRMEITLNYRRCAHTFDY